MTENTYVNPALNVHGRLVTTATTADLSNPQICSLVGLTNSFCGQAVLRNTCQKSFMFKFKHFVWPPFIPNTFEEVQVLVHCGKIMIILPVHAVISIRSVLVVKFHLGHLLNQLLHVVRHYRILDLGRIKGRGEYFVIFGCHHHC